MYSINWNKMYRSVIVLYQETYPYVCEWFLAIQYNLNLR